MNFCHDTLAPESICEVYNQARPGVHKSATKDKQVLAALWDQCGQATIEVIAAGAVTLGAIWQAAWTLAGKPDTTPWLATIYDGTKDLMPVYEDKKFLPSLHLQYLGANLPGSDAPVTPPPQPTPNAAARVQGQVERGHQPQRPSAPARSSAHRTAGTTANATLKKTGRQGNRTRHVEKSSRH